MEKKSNAMIVWPAILLMVVACPILALIGFDEIGYTAFFIGVLLLIYAMATGRLKLFG